jgi:putative ABC transport system permease protein
VAPDTWREVQNANRPDAPVDAGTFEVLVVDGTGDPAELAAAIDAATDDTTSTLTKSEAVLSLPGTRQQRSTFNGIIFVTFGVVGLVVALFFALLTLERTAVYGVLKAIGASTAQLFRGLLLQAAVVGAIAFVVGALLTLVLAALLPDTIPLRVEPSRAVTTLLGVLATAIVGGAVSLRRIARVDPASAIGTGT